MHVQTAATIQWKAVAGPGVSRSVLHACSATYPPIAASRTASHALAVCSVLSGSGFPVASMAAPPISS